MRKKRENKLGLFSSLFPSKKNPNKMNDMIRDTPDSAENSKFHGSFVLSDLENDDK